MKVTVFGATGVVGRALLPLLVEHEVTAVSRTPRSRTTSSTHWDRGISSNRTAQPRRPSRGRRSGQE